MDKVFKILNRRAWADACAAGVFRGAAIDLTDGYIHLSSADQVRDTARLHFAGQDDLLLIAFAASALGSSLRWEPSRGGALFPHLYGSLDPALALWARPLPWQGTHHAFPEGWDA